jgi:hypothetical protein
MQPSSIDGVIRKTESASTLEQLRACLLDVLLIVTQQNAELNDLRTRKGGVIAALSTFQKAHKNRSARR